MFYVHETDGIVEVIPNDDGTVDVVHYTDAMEVDFAEQMSARFIESCVGTVLVPVEDQLWYEMAARAGVENYGSTTGWVVMARKTGDLARRLSINQEEFVLAGPFYAHKMGYLAANQKAANIVAGTDSFWYRKELAMTECQLRKWVVRIER